MIGELHDVEVRVTCHMPWEIWTFLFGIPRMEVLYHSIHYVDLVRSFLGEPAGVYCKTVKHPRQMQLASTRTAIAFDYGDVKRATITTNHGHDFGPRHQESYFKLEGTEGAIKGRIGVNLDYPRGAPDNLEYCVRRADGRYAGMASRAARRKLVSPRVHRHHGQRHAARRRRDRRAADVDRGRLPDHGSRRGVL